MKNPQARELLETIGETFLLGYGHAMEARTVAEAEERLEEVPARFRGFAYEGAGMGFAVLDAMPFGGGKVDAFLAGRGGRHIYMVYVGVGWAMARLPRFLWPKTGGLDPLLRWLVLDGYGFHQAYFRTDQYVHGHYQDPAFPWPSGPSRPYASRALDQGVGRALWFVAGTDADRCASLIERFDPSRRADLYAGAGLAATYAGGAAEEELRELWNRAGEHRPLLAQGSAFAAEARVRAGLVVPHVRRATEIFCGLPEDQAAQVTQRVRPQRPAQDGDPPAYELWRQRIATEFVSLGGVVQ